MTRSLTALLSLVFVLMLGACADDYGESCSLPDSVQVEAFCESGDDGEGGSAATCVFTNSAQCSSRVCARYIGSEDFCTVECDPEDANSCTGDSFCQVVASRGFAFCVPLEISVAVQ